MSHEFIAVYRTWKSLDLIPTDCYLTSSEQHVSYLNIENNCTKNIKHIWLAQ